MYYATRVALIRKNCQMRPYGVMLISSTRATARNWYYHKKGNRNLEDINKHNGYCVTRKAWQEVINYFQSDKRSIEILGRNLIACQYEVISSFLLFREAKSALQIVKYFYQRHRLHLLEAGLYYIGNRFWNTVAVIQEPLRNSNSGKIYTEYVKEHEA